MKRVKSSYVLTDEEGAVITNQPASNIIYNGRLTQITGRFVYCIRGMSVARRHGVERASPQFKSVYDFLFLKLETAILSEIRCALYGESVKHAKPFAILKGNGLFL